MAFFTPEQLAVLSASTVRVAFLVEFQFESTTFRAWNGNHQIESGGNTWLPMKGAGNIDGIVVNGGERSDKVEFTLNGLPDQEIDFLNQALSETEDVNQKSVLIYLQLFDEHWQPKGAPIGVWWGFMQPPKVSRTPMQGVEGGVQTIAVSAENAFYNRSRPPHGRYTDREQQKRSSGDRFFQFTPGLLFKVFTYPDY